MLSPLSEHQIRTHLQTKTIGRTIVVLPTVDSTNTYGKMLMAKPFEEGTLIIAEEQTAGRGRQGRLWFNEQIGRAHV